MRYTRSMYYTRKHPRTPYAPMSAQSDLRILDSFVILVDCYAVYVKDTAFGSQKYLRNDRCTTQKKWERSPLFIVMFLLNSLGFILRFGRQFVDI